jgi:hypothetical protein
MDVSVFVSVGGNSVQSTHVRDSDHVAPVLQREDLGAVCAEYVLNNIAQFVEHCFLKYTFQCVVEGLVELRRRWWAKFPAAKE